MKIKKFLSLMLLVLVAMLLVACGDKAQDIADENLANIAITYTTGDSASSVTSDVTLGKVELEGLTVAWASDNEAVISKEGKVTRPAAGADNVNVKLTVTVTYKDATASKDFTLVVKALPEVKPLSIEITGVDKMVEGAEYTLTATVLPENATNKAVTWASDNEEVATIDANGKVTAKKAGAVNFTATSAASSSVVGTLAVTVVVPSADTIAATQAKEKGAEGWVKGVVVAAYSRGYLLADGTGYILVYMDKTAFTQNVGDYVEVKGVLGEYNGAKQFDATATVTAIEGEAPSVEVKAEKLKDNAAAAAYLAAFVMFKRVTFRMTVTSASDSYINGTIKDGDVAIAIAYPADKAAYTVGKDYDVTGYALYTKEYNSVNTLYLMAEKAIEVDYGFDVHITYKDGTQENTETINSLQFPVMELAEPEEKEGYVFLGWYTGTEEAPVRAYALYSAEDTTLFARWVAEEDAPLFVDPTCEDGSMYTSITAAVYAAKEGQEIILAPGEYVEDYITPAERVYNTKEALLAAFGADFVAFNNLQVEDEETKEKKTRTVDVSLFETATAESSWITAFLSDAEMTQKWSWFYKAIAEVVGNEDMDPETFTPADVRFNFIVNFYGFFTGTQHTETYSKSCVSADWSNPLLVQQVILAGAKLNGDDAEDTHESKIYIDKSVKITGPNANVNGHSEDRNEEANITSKFIITADYVTIDGCEFSGDAVIQLGGDSKGASLKHCTIKNCNVHTDVYGANPTSNNNRKGSIITAGTMEDLQIIDTSIVFAGSSYTSVAIDFAGEGGTTGYTAKDISIIGCYFESTNTTAAAYEMIMAYNNSGTFNFINNEVRVGISGYLIRLGYYKTSCTEINIIDNDFLGLGDLAGASIGANAIDSTNGQVWNVIGNNFENFAPSSFVFGTTGTTTLGTVFNYKYNYFSDKQAWKISAIGSVVINHSNNLTLAAYDAANVVDIKANDNTYADKAALDEAYAAYKATLHKVTFDADAAYDVLPIYFENAKSVTLPTPEKEGYVFGGWYEGDTLVTKLTDNKDYNLKAKWLVTYYVTFDTDGAGEIDRISFDTVGTVELPMNLTKVVEFESTEGHKYETVADIAAAYVADFKDYAGSNLADGASIDTAHIDSGSIVNMLSDAAMNAKWAWLYNALFAAAGSPEGMEYTHADATVKGFYLANLCGFFTGTQHTDTYLSTVSADYTVEATNTAIINAGPKASIYKHYVISGWYEGETPVTAITELRNYELKATYVEAKTITFDTDGAAEIAPIYFANASLVELPTPTKTGYYFLGWYEGETPVTAISEVRDYNLKAQWREIKTLTVNPTPGKVYADVAAIEAAYMADFNAKQGRTDLTKANLTTSAGESSWMKDMLEDSTLLAKWTWLYSALATASGKTALDPTIAGFTADGAKFLALANLYGFFYGEAHADPYSASTMCADFSVEATSDDVVAAGPDQEAYTTLAAAIAAAEAGDTIVVPAGIYNEEVTITKNDITIIGAKSYDLEHDDSYSVGDADTKIKKITVNADRFTLKNVVITKQVAASNFEDLTIESVYLTSGTDGIIYITGENKNLNIKDLYADCAAPRIIYLASGKMENATFDHIVVMDAATVTFTETGAYSAGICDVIRFGMSNTAIAEGDVVIKNCYFRAGQTALMDRLPNADSYTIYNNYFDTIPAAVYFRTGTLANPTVYNITYNTFVKCGNMTSDWDVLAITTSENTTVDVHYNVFADSFYYNGTSADYVIKVRTAAGDIDCANNYFKNLDDARFVNQNAEGLTLLDLGSTVDYAPQAYDQYKIMIVNKKVMVYGVNYQYVPATVKLDDEAAVEVAVGHYTLPTPTKDGYDFQGWYEGDTQVTEITEGKAYTLTSHWENFSKYYNVEGCEGFYAYYDQFRAELLADYNAYAGKSFTYDTITDSTWTIIAYANFFLANAEKYRSLVNYLANDGSACAPAWAALLVLIDAGVTTAVNGENGWKTDPYNYELNYTMVAMIKAKLNTAHSTLHTADFSTAAVQDAVLALYQPTKAGYTFDGWYEDAEFTTAATSIEKYGHNYYAKWTELPKYDVTLTLNGGTPYADTDAMIAAFIEAYSTYYGVSGVTGSNWSDKMEATCNASTWHYNDFFTANPEWNWFLTFYTALLDADTTWLTGGSYGPTSKYSWRMGIQAYATQTERTSWPKVAADSTLVTRSVDWATYYTATTMTMSQVYGTNTLPTVYKAGYTFAGWYDNAEFTGDAITSVTEAKTLYAKWEAEQSAN